MTASFRTFPGLAATSAPHHHRRLASRAELRFGHWMPIIKASIFIISSFNFFFVILWFNPSNNFIPSIRTISPGKSFIFDLTLFGLNIILCPQTLSVFSPNKCFPFVLNSLILVTIYVFPADIRSVLIYTTQASFDIEIFADINPFPYGSPVYVLAFQSPFTFTFRIGCVGNSDI